LLDKTDEFSDKLASKLVGFSEKIKTKFNRISKNKQSATIDGTFKQTKENLKDMFKNVLKLFK